MGEDLFVSSPTFASVTVDCERQIRQRGNKKLEVKYKFYWCFSRPQERVNIHDIGPVSRSGESVKLHYTGPLSRSRESEVTLQWFNFKDTGE